MRIWTVVFALVLALISINAQAARRLGGGKSVGQQSSQVTQREAARPATPPAQNAATPTAPTAPPAVVPARKPWGAMLGGLAAGLGLAWLASSLGLGEAFGQVLMFGLLALGVMLVAGWFLRSRRSGAAPSAATAAGPLAYQTAGEAELARPPSSYRPENVGNDASARPWERNSMSFEAGSAQPPARSMIGSALNGPQTWGIPAGFDTQGFLSAAKSNFVKLQAAWDASDTQVLRSMMTDEMLQEIKVQLTERDAQAGGQAGATEVVMLQAELLGIEERGNDYMASVEFSGMIREDASSGPNPFREAWNMTKPRDGSAGWLVAGVQALQ